MLYRNSAWLLIFCNLLAIYAPIHAMESSIADTSNEERHQGKDKQRVERGIALVPQAKEEAAIRVCWFCSKHPSDSTTIAIPICALCKSDMKRTEWPEMCRYGRLEEYKALLTKYPELISAKQDGHEFPLQQAMMGFLVGSHKNTELIRFLLEEGAEQRFHSSHTFEGLLLTNSTGYEAGSHPQEARILLRVLAEYRAKKEGKADSEVIATQTDEPSPVQNQKARKSKFFSCFRP